MSVAQNKVIVAPECETVVKKIAGNIVRQCNFLLDNAETYQKYAEEQVITLEQLSVKQDSVIERQAKYISEIKQYNDKWYKKPVYVGILSFLVGGLAISTLER